MQNKSINTKKSLKKMIGQKVEIVRQENKIQKIKKRKKDWSRVFKAIIAILKKRKKLSPKK